MGRIDELIGLGWVEWCLISLGGIFGSSIVSWVVWFFRFKNYLFI